MGRGARAVRALAGALLAWAAVARGAEAAPASVWVLEVRGPITPPMEHYVVRELRRAERAGASAMVLRLDTPGGLLTSTDAIVQAILGSRAPVVAYVAPAGARAASAGVFLVYAAHVAAMAPATNLGSATPVRLGGPPEADSTPSPEARKAMEDAAAKLRALAQLRGRNAAWAEAAVRRAANVTAEEAQRLRVVDVVAPDLPALLAALDGRRVRTAAGEVTLRTRGAQVRTVAMGARESFLHALTSPEIAYLLLSLGFLALLVEFAHPGAVVPGVVGAIALLLGLYGVGSLPVNWTGLLLMALGFGMFVAELYLPTHGALGIGGALAFGLGSLLLLETSRLPGLAVPLSLVGTMSALLLLSVLGLGVLVARAQRRRPATGTEALVGAVAVARTPLAPEGFVHAAGELWRARVRGASVPAGARVRVVGRDGLTLLVDPDPTNEP